MEFTRCPLRETLSSMLTMRYNDTVKKIRELETDFTKDSKSCQPTSDEQFPVLREKDHNDRLTDHYLQYQPNEITNYVKEFSFRYSDITDEEIILLIDMLVDARDV